MTRIETIKATSTNELRELCSQLHQRSTDAMATREVCREKLRAVETADRLDLLAYAELESRADGATTRINRLELHKDFIDAELAKRQEQ